MTGYCKNCKMNYAGKNCPICHGGTDTSAKPISLGIVIVGIVILVGFLVYTGGIQIDKENLESELEYLKREIYKREINLPIDTITAFNRFSERI